MSAGTDGNISMEIRIALGEKCGVKWRLLEKTASLFLTVTPSCGQRGNGISGDERAFKLQTKLQSKPFGNLIGDEICPFLK